MVFAIRPRANHLNHAIDLEYEKSPAAKGSWYQFLRSEKLIPQDDAPTSIISKRPNPLPDAFEVSRDFWCVSAPVREVMERLFGTQASFYEVPVAVKGSGASLPSTHFVTFSHFRNSIDWRSSRITSPTRFPAKSALEVVGLANVPDAAAFEANPTDPAMIWIEKKFQQGNRVHVPGYDVYTTNAGALLMSQSFPEDFILTQFKERARKARYVRR